MSVQVGRPAGPTKLSVKAVSEKSLGTRYLGLADGESTLWVPAGSGKLRLNYISSIGSDNY